MSTIYNKVAQWLMVCLLIVAPWTLGGVAAQEVVNLSGLWQLSLGDSTSYDDCVILPGSLLTNDKGDDVGIKTQWTGSLYDSSYYFNPYMAPYRQPGQMKFPFFLTPEKHYVGRAWYKRSVYVPQSFQKRRLVLHLERPHIETTVYVNGTEVGHQQSLSTPHEYDVTKFVVPGQRNTVAICVYNGIENVCVGQDSHSVTDQTQGNWNGIVGRMELQSLPRKLSIKSVRVFPDVAQQKALVLVTFNDNVEGGGFSARFGDYAKVEATAANTSTPQLVASGWEEVLHRQMTFTLNLATTMQTWDEFSPVYYNLTVYAGDDAYKTRFGMRDIQIEGRQLYINGRPLYLRGTVENCCFPETGYPPTDEAEWKRIFRQCRDYGINHVRFHSYCPPEAAFCAADELGIYLQPEGPSWPNHGVKLRRGQPIDQYLLDESRRIVDTYGNHPSFVMMAAGNEPAGDWVGYCNDWVRSMHAYDPTKIYCGASVGGGWAWDDGSEYHVKGGARGLDWERHAPQSADDYYAQIEFPRNYRDSLPNTSPIIAHEQGQWCAFPDFRELSQYTGAYKARNFEIFRDLLRTGGMAPVAEKFLQASGNLQVLCYKYEIERNLRTPDYAGFQLLGLNDYSGQGTALVGPLNVHWREKGYTNAREWRRFCSPLVLLARFPKFIYTTADTLSVPVEAYNAYVGELKDVTPSYTLWANDSLIYAMGDLPSTNIPVGKNNALGTITVPLDSITRATRMRLIVQLGRLATNNWELWVYPLTVDSTSQTSNLNPQTSNPPLEALPFMTDTLDAAALDVLRRGGDVLLTAAGKVSLGSDVVQHYLPVFWNTSWFKMRPPHTTGAYIDTSHPLFKYDFPTDSWANLNWWELLNRAQVMNLRELPADYQPPIQPIDTWHVSRKLGMLIEARVLKGRLLMTTMDISNGLDRRLVARQMRHAILSYMQSPDFQPSLTLSPDVIGHFFTMQAPPVNMFTNDSPDELKPKLK